MDQPKAVCSANNLLQSRGDLLVVTGSENPHDTSHRPGLAESGMGTTHTWISQLKNKIKQERSVRVDDWAAHEIWIIIAEDKFAGGLVDGVADVQVTEEGSAQKTRDVGVVHEITCVTLVYSNQFI
jgi:hypothetical protein